MSAMELLPTELHLIICKQLPATSIVQIALTSKRFYNLYLPEAFFDHPDARRKALIWACENGGATTVRLALAAGAPVNEACEEEPWVFPISKHYNFNEDNGPGREPNHGVSFRLSKTPLALAIMHGHVDIFDMLRVHGATPEQGLQMEMRDVYATEINNPDWVGQCSPFRLVRHMPMYRALVSAGYQDPQMHLAALVFEDDATGLCLSTLSWLIIRNAEIEVIKAAIENGNAAMGSIDAEGPSDVPPLVLACQYGYFEAAIFMTNRSLEPENSALVYPQTLLGAKQEYNAAVWYGLLSIGCGFWKAEATQLLNFLHLSVRLGLDVNDTIVNPSDAPLMHLAMMPHVDASVAKGLVSLGADPTRLARMSLQDCWRFVYGNWPSCESIRPYRTHYEDTMPLQGLLWVLEHQEYSKIPMPKDVFVNSSGLPITSHFEVNQRAKLVLMAEWALLYAGYHYMLQFFEHQSKPDIYTLTLLSEVGKLVDLKDPYYRDLIEAALGQCHQDCLWYLPLDGTLEALTTAVEICAALSYDFTEDTLDTSAASWVDRYLGSGYTARRFIPLDTDDGRWEDMADEEWLSVEAVADVDGRRVDMGVEDYRRWVDFVSSWSIDSDGSTTAWETFKQEVIGETRATNEERLRAACLELDQKLGR